MAYFEAIDCILCKLKERIENKAISVLIATEKNLMDSWQGHAVDQCDLDRVCHHYAEELDKHRLAVELLRLESLQPSG